jgi:predicted oxidoreductase
VRLVNQAEISMANTSASGDGTLDHCLGERLTPLAWSLLGGGLLADGAQRPLPAQKAFDTSRVTTIIDALAARNG